MRDGCDARHDDCAASTPKRPACVPEADIEEDCYATPTTSNSKRRRGESYCGTPMSQAETPSSLDRGTPLDDCDDGYTTPTEEVHGLRRAVYSKCATTGFAPPEKCFAPWRPRCRPGDNSIAVLHMVGGADSPWSDDASLEAGMSRKSS